MSRAYILSHLKQYKYLMAFRNVFAVVLMGFSFILLWSYQGI